MASWVLNIHIVSLFCLLGCVWLLQVLVYPNFQDVAATNFKNYHLRHRYRTSFTIIPLMLIEVVSGLLLLWHKPPLLLDGVMFLNLSLIGFCWASLFLFHVPIQKKLSMGKNQQAIERLQQVHWLRTVLYSLRGLIWFSILLTLIP